MPRFNFNVMAEFLAAVKKDLFWWVVRKIPLWISPAMKKEMKRKRQDENILILVFVFASLRGWLNYERLLFSSLAERETQFCISAAKTKTKTKKMFLNQVKNISASTGRKCCIQNICFQVSTTALSSLATDRRVCMESSYGLTLFSSFQN